MGLSISRFIIAGQSKRQGYRIRCFLRAKTSALQIRKQKTVYASFNFCASNAFNCGHAVLSNVVRRRSPTLCPNRCSQRICKCPALKNSHPGGVLFHRKKKKKNGTCLFINHNEKRLLVRICDIRVQIKKSSKYTKLRILNSRLVYS